MFDCIRPFKFHKWGKWRITGSGKLISTSVIQTDLNTGERLATGSYVRQIRTCVDCDAVQVRMVTS